MVSAQRQNNGVASLANMYSVVALFVGIIAFILFLAELNSEIFNNVRAFVEGESLWSKGQKDAVIYLNKYSLSRSEEDYSRFIQAISLPLGDKLARLELEKSQPQLERAYSGFIMGGNHPDDVAGMADFFIRYRHLSYMDKAIKVWSEGDRQIEELLVLAYRLHQMVSSSEDSPENIQQIKQRLDDLNTILSNLEREFSATLGEAAHWVSSLTKLVIYSSTLVLVISGLICSSWIFRRIYKTETALLASEASFRRIAESNIIGIAFWEDSGAITDANEAFLKIIDYDVYELQAGYINWKKLTPPEFQQRDAQAMAEIVKTGVCGIYEKEFIRKDGSHVSVCIGAALMDGFSNKGVGFVLDISEKSRAEEQFRLAAKVMESSSKAIVVSKSDGNIIAINRAFTEITGYTPEEITGSPLSILNAKPLGCASLDEVFDSIEKYKQWQGEMLGRRKNGEYFPLWNGISSVLGPSGDITHYVSIFSDISERKAAEEHSLLLARHDSLTGLPNRELLGDRVNYAIEFSRKNEQKFALLFLDLDGFKKVNDTLGHQAGDQLLKIVAERLVAHVRVSDFTVCRQGGDEFVILLEGIRTIRNAFIIANKLVDAIEQPCEIEGTKIYVGASVGVSVYPDDGDDFDTLIRYADHAMYQVKYNRKNNSLASRP